MNLFYSESYLLDTVVTIMQLILSDARSRDATSHASLFFFLIGSKLIVSSSMY